MVSRRYVHQCKSRFKVDCSEQLNNRTCLCKNDTRHLITKISYAYKGPSEDRQLHTLFVTNFIAADTQESGSSNIVQQPTVAILVATENIASSCRTVGSFSVQNNSCQC